MYGFPVTSYDEAVVICPYRKTYLMINNFDLTSDLVHTISLMYRSQWLRPYMVTTQIIFIVVFLWGKVIED